MHSIIENEIRRMFEDEGVVLLEISISGRANKPFMRVIGDRRQGFLSIDDCVRLSRGIQHLIAEKKLLAEDYRLEVSSPGLDYPLREDWQYQKNLGRLLKINVPGERGPREISGRLTSVDSRGITLQADGKEWTPQFTEIISVRVLPEFKPPRSESKE